MVAELSLADGFDLTGVDIADVWMRYVAIGGTAGRERLGAMLTRGTPVPARERVLVAQSLNEVFLDLGMPTFPVGYLSGSTAPADIPVGRAPERAARRARRSAEARRRSAEIHEQSSELHLTAARLLLASGQALRATNVSRHAVAADQRAQRCRLDTAGAP